MKLVLAVLALLIVVLGCGTTSTSSSTGPSSIASLPRATGAVDSSTAVIRGARDNVDLFSATTGVVLKDINSTTFTDKSRAFCETAQTVKNLLREASKNDKVACYIGAMDAAGAFTNSYDGTWKYYSFSGASDKGGMKIKFKATKDASGVVDSFEMFTCEADVHTEYLNTTVAGGSANLIAVGSHSKDGEGGSTFTGAHRVTVSGTYASGTWTGSKTIIGQGTFGASGGGNTFTDNRYAELVQSATTLTLQGSHSHTFNNGSAHTGSGLVYAIIQGLNMGELSTFALGDGTGKAQFVFDATTHSGEASWDGDTRENLASASSGEYYETVHNASLPSATTPDPDFTEDETWDCTAEGSFSTVNFEALKGDLVFFNSFKTCNDTFGDNFGHGFIDCHSGD